MRMVHGVCLVDFGNVQVGLESAALFVVGGGFEFAFQLLDQARSLFAL